MWIYRIALSIQPVANVKTAAAAQSVGKPCAANITTGVTSFVFLALPHVSREQYSVYISVGY